MNRIAIATMVLAAGVALMPALAQDTAPPAPAPAAAPAEPAPAATVAAPAVAPAPANTGRLYIAYPANPRATFPSQLALNGSWSANTVAPGSCQYFDLAPGSYSIATLSTSKATVDIAAGDSKFVELQIRKEAFGDDKRDTTAPRTVDKLADTSTCQHADAPGS